MEIVKGYCEENLELSVEPFNQKNAKMKVDRNFIKV